MAKIDGNDKIVGRPVKLNRVKTSDSEKILIPIGDIHYGAPSCNVEKLKRMLEYCREKNAWILLMGDLFEFATRTSVGSGVYEQIATPQEQLDDLVEIFSPYADLIIGAHRGNHENRCTIATGMDVTKIFCNSIGVRYLDFAIDHVLEVGKQRYIVYSTHGSSGATLPHTKIKKVMDIGNWNFAHLYLYGHVHSLESKTNEVMVYDSRNKCKVAMKRYFVLTGSYLEYSGYAKEKGYQPEKTGSVKIMLSGKEHDIHVST